MIIQAHAPYTHHPKYKARELQQNREGRRDENIIRNNKMYISKSTDIIIRSVTNIKLCEGQKPKDLITIFISLPVPKNRQNSKEMRDNQAPSFSSGTEHTVQGNYFQAEEWVMKWTLQKKRYRRVQSETHGKCTIY